MAVGTAIGMVDNHYLAFASGVLNIVPGEDIERTQARQITTHPIFLLYNNLSTMP